MEPVSRQPIEARPELVGPDYNLYQYRPDFYKVVRFKSTAPRLGAVRKPKEEGFKHKDKLPASLSRARRVCLELALCNDWKWFATFTIASNNYDRKNLEGFYKRFREWMKYQNKKHKMKLPYLLVPEQHGDGSWHMHGFFNSDIDGLLVPFQEIWDAGKKIPYKLVEKGYYNWPDYQQKFGFCSFGEIRNHDAAAFYATKYISKSFQGDARKVGLRLYFNSQGLNRAQFFDSLYGPCPALNQCLVNDYEFCQTGFFTFERQVGDDPLLDILEYHHGLFDLAQKENPQEEFPEVDDYYEMMQEVLADF